MKIYKYPLPIQDRVVLPLPFGAKVLSVQCQDTSLCLWAEVEETAPVVERTFCIYGTGHRLSPNPGRYCGTAVVGHYVWHVYEEGAGALEE